jgi:lysine-specific demethylase 8
MDGHHARGDHKVDIQYIANILSKELSRPYPEDDPILKCGPDCLAIIKSHPQIAQLISYTRLKAYPFKDVPECWRRLYCDAALWDAAGKLEACAAFAVADKPAENPTTTAEREIEARRERRAQMARPEFDEAVGMLDMALIMSGAPRREQLVHTTMDRLHAFLASAIESLPQTQESPELSTDKDGAPNPPKRRRVGFTQPRSSPAASPQRLICPTLKRPIPRVCAPSMQSFQMHLDCSDGPAPLVITDSISHWPALQTRPWSSTAYLLDATLGGRRHVPVEIGSSYTDARWGQRLMRFDEFVARYMDPERTVMASERGYLAQHDLLTQMPRLRADIGVPEYCYCEPPPAEDKADEVTHEDCAASEPAINAWFGPAHTVSPLHTDPHHNILAQVVGHKYVRLYSPAGGDALRPMQDREGGIDMSNTSRVDLSQWIHIVEGWDGWSTADGLDDPEDETENETADELSKKFPDFESSPYYETILAPGDCLYIPRSWWHYVRSLSPSFSVSFWWD